MAFNLTNLTANVNNIQGLSDKPNTADGITAQELKQKFDKAGADIKSYINGTLIPELETKVDNIDSSMTNMNSTIQTIMGLLHPVGSIYISVNNVNPQTIFGGTWEAFGTGRTLVGIDTSQTEFNTVEKTGGSKLLQKHNHTMGSAGNHIHKTSTGGDIATANWGYGWYDPHFKVGNSDYGYHMVGFGSAGSHTHTINNAGTGESGNLQPYITVYMWKRIA